MQLLLASNNPMKRAELERLLAPSGVELVTPAGLGGLPEVVEDRPTFRANAALKAVSAARVAGRWALADDSGLEVDELGGAPGVLSARFAGLHGDDAANNAALLARLAGVPAERRGARFTCALALADPAGRVRLEIEAHARGRILEAPRGPAGFGYDPLFLFTEEGFAERGRSFAELSPDEKARVSHRGRALRELAARLPEVLADPTCRPA
jgi:XTP/dITP diphosphohydrolase